MSSNSDPKTVLIAEDDVDILNIWRRGLERVKFNVVTTADGQQAIDYLDNNPLPALVILDHNMPNTSGLEVLAHLNTIDPDHTVKRMMVTANPTASVEASHMGVDLFLMKPVGYAEIKTFVVRLLS